MNGPFLSLNERKGPFTALPHPQAKLYLGLSAMNGPFLSPSATKGPFIAFNPTHHPSRAQGTYPQELGAP
jgi:hypothetical protein